MQPGSCHIHAIGGAAQSAIIKALTTTAETGITPADKTHLPALLSIALIQGYGRNLCHRTVEVEQGQVHLTGAVQRARLAWPLGVKKDSCNSVRLFIDLHGVAEPVVEHVNADLLYAVCGRNGPTCCDQGGYTGLAALILKQRKDCRIL